MIIVDAHCDTLIELNDDNDLFCNSLHLDLDRIEKIGKGFVQFFAAFVEPQYSNANSLRWVISIINRLYIQAEKYAEHISLCTDYKSIIKAINSKKIAAILSIEDGCCLQGSLEVLRVFYRLGVRCMSLTWNYRNDIADGIMELSSKGGLSDFGIKVVEEMNKIGMIIDVSHLSVNGFYDVMEKSISPVIASHSNAKSICNHPRNLDDNQIKAIIKKNGVIGINFYPDFLNNKNKADSEDIIKHIEHICSLGGIDNTGFGSDFDGIGSTPDDIKGVQDYNRIINRLLELNYREEHINKICGENLLRVIKEVCR